MADDSTKLIIVLEAQSRKLQNSLVQVNKNIDRFAAQTERRFELMQKKMNGSFDQLTSKLRGSVGGLQNLLGPLAGTLGAREVIRFADAWDVAGNKIAAAGQVAGIRGRGLDELKDSANATRTSLEEYVDLYARLLRSSTAVAAGELEVARVTDIVAKSLKAGGASAQEQQAALIQLGQALGSGILQGDELRSLRENAPLIARAIAQEFGVTIGELKALGAEGKLTSDRVFKAILAGGKDIDEAFKATRATVGDALTVINNEFTAYIGTTGRASGATQALIDALMFLADNFKTVGDTVITFATIMAVALAGKAIGAVVVGLGQAVVALATFLGALRAGTATMALFAAAVSPIAIIAAAAAAGIGLLAYMHGEADRAAKAHAATLDINNAAIENAVDMSKEYRDSLKREIDLQLEAADASLTAADAHLKNVDAMARLAGATAILVGGLFGEGYESRQKAADKVYADMTGGAVAGVEEARTYLEKLREQRAELEALGDGTSTKDKLGGGSGGKDNGFDKKLKSVIDQTEMIIALTNAQRELNPLVNDYGYAVDKARTAEELRQAAMEAGIKITPELAGQIEFLADGYARAGVEAKKLAESQEEQAEKVKEYFGVARDSLRGFIDDLIEGKTATEALGNALGKIGDKLIDMGLEALLGTGSGSNPFGAVGKLFGLAKGGIVSNGRPRMFAKGGVSSTAAVFGEAGPEAAVPLPDGRRIPVDLRMPQGGGSGAISAPVSIVIDATGADAAGLARVERQLAALKTSLPATVVATVRTARKQRQL